MKKFMTVAMVLMVAVAAIAGTKPVRIYVIGDDACMFASATAPASMGWLAELTPKFSELAEVKPVNAGLTEDDVLLENALKGDFVLLDVCPVMEPVKELTAVERYEHRLIAFCDAAKKKKVNLVLMTPVAPRYFMNDSLIDRTGIFPEVVRRVAALKKVPLIDLSEFTMALLKREGAEGSAAYYVAVTEGPVAELSHVAAGSLMTKRGAEVVAAMIVEQLKSQKKFAPYIQ